MAYSFSRLSTYKSCPRQFKFHYIDGLADVSGEAAELGSLIHEALELDDASLVMHNQEAYHMFKLGRGYMEGLKGVIGKEVKLAIDVTGQPCGYDDEKALFRGIIDVLGENFILDWKTGFKMVSPLQLGAYQLLAEAHGYYPTELKYCMLRYDKFDTIYSSPELFNEARKFIIETVQAIESDKEYKRNIGSHCEWCSYVGKCQEGLEGTPELNLRRLILILAEEKQLKEKLKKYVNETGTDVVADDVIYGNSPNVSKKCKDKNKLLKELKAKDLLSDYAEVKSSEYKRLLEEHPEFEDFFKESIRNNYGFKEFKIAAS